MPPLIIHATAERFGRRGEKSKSQKSKVSSTFAVLGLSTFRPLTFRPVTPLAILAHYFLEVASSGERAARPLRMSRLGEEHGKKSKGLKV